ncbi:MAG: alpha/beta fold hydrolase [Thermomicrobiales bacterium]
MPPVTPTSTRRIDVGAAQLHVEEFGRDAPPLLLLHGIGSSGNSWLPVIPQLAARFRLIVPDWRGHGKSDKPPGGYLVGDYADDLEGLLGAYSLDRPRILGHSLGGLVATEWASRHPAAAARIALEDIPFRGGDARLFDDWIALASMTPEAAADHYRIDHPDWTDEERHRRAESITSTRLSVFTELRDHHGSDVGADLRIVDSLSASKAPILLVHGDVESVGMVAQPDADRFASDVPLADVVRIPGGSHSLHRDASAAFIAAVLPFLLSD